MSFFVPSFSKAISRMLSGPMGRTASTVPLPKALCSTVSPALSFSCGALGGCTFGAGFFGVGVDGRL